MSTELTAPTLSDADQREAITKELGTTLFVEAGAGSGKTSSLVQRIVRLVDQGNVPINRIAAITFTEAAARELRVRVRDELENRAESSGNAQLIEAAGLVESAAFTTLHGFALRILSDNPIEAGLPPGFGVLDEVTTTLEFEESWRVFAGRIGDDLSLLELQERGAALGISLRPFSTVARRLDDNWDLLQTVTPQGQSAVSQLSALDFEALYAELDELDTLRQACLTQEDKLAIGIAQLLDAVTELRDDSVLDQMQGLGDLPWPRRNGGAKGNWHQVSVDEARRTVIQKRDAVEAKLESYKHEVIKAYTELVTKFVLDRVEDRRSKGELAFHDLLVLARRLLRSNETVRFTLHQRYSRILLDEFQDTDPIQIELAVLLAADRPVGETPWPELAADLPPGRLVVVGDPKQSIYRFRRADIGVYAAAEKVLVDQVSRLTTNFRSVPGIVEWVNRVFGDAMGRGVEGQQPSYTPLVAFRDQGPTVDSVDRPVVVFGHPHDRRDSKVSQIREQEGQDVAAIVCRAMAEGWQVERDGAGDWRPIRLKDIAVLIPSRLSLPSLESGFDAANIPFRPETSSLVYATQEVRTVLAGVRAIADPTNSIDVVAALRSSLFSIGDDELLEWKLAAGSWDYRNVEVPEGLDGSAIDQAYGVLRRWHSDRWWREPSTLVDRIVRERRLRESALAEPRPRDRWRRYRFLIEQARQFQENRGGDLQDFVAWVEIQSSDMARVTEPIPAEPDDDAVRVLTIHGAKGLEFPMVILAGASTKEGSGKSGPDVLFDRDNKPLVALNKATQAEGYGMHASIEELLDSYESIRLHYVAATRARDFLVVSAHHKDGTTCMGSRTWSSVSKEPTTITLEDLAAKGSLEEAEAAEQEKLERPRLVSRFEATGDERFDERAPTQLRLSGGDYGEDLAQWHRGMDAVTANSLRSGFWSATAVASALAPPFNADSEAVDDHLDAGAGLGRELGTAVHSVIETVSFDLDTDGNPDIGSIVEQSRAAVKDGSDLLSAEDVAVRVEHLVRSPAVALARRWRHWRELYVAIPAGPAGLEGFVDLVVETDEGLIVVDYKTDFVRTPSDVDDKVSRYGPQAAAYAIALEHITGKLVCECRFVFVVPEGTIERSVEDLAAEKARVSAKLGITD